jgi:hypothetical protein
MAMRYERFARSVDFKRSRHLCVYARASRARSAAHSMRLWFAGIAVARRHSLHRLCNDASVATAHEHTISAARRHVDERRFHRATVSACLLAVCAITATHRIGISVLSRRSARTDPQRLPVGMKPPRRCRARRLPAGFLATRSPREMTSRFHL